MTVLKAHAILEDAVLECRQRNVNTPEVTEALDFLEPHIRPTWLIPQYRHALHRHGDQGYHREAQQQVLRPSFEGIRNSVRGLLRTRLERLGRQFATARDMKIKEEIERLAAEHDKLKEPWQFVAK
jgi:hypothetical protein